MVKIIIGKRSHADDDLIYSIQTTSFVLLKRKKKQKKLLNRCRVFLFLEL